ncbi:MAG: DNA-directed RNA polymerase subunit alpha [Acidobacteria bacterium]|nr:DNA-directed RNA polymerase subunit alpha [Acidobacteriota bacterium]MCG3192496.1 DNA-directed RNA polymerase subunit alpha [Thermoanaerobaculia bacterium]MCK6683329.1 DNA-directed RNA polymerase subunit alpha [Thermoanaerobaculia bacterium]
MTSLGFQRPNRLEVEEESKDKTFARFSVQPLERGWGTTIGNALRRVLLSSIEGAAITSVRIEGVEHEFSAIPGVVEDVTDIILNLKTLAIRLHSDSPRTLTLDAKSKGQIVANDFEDDPHIEILNSEALVAQLAEGGRLHIEATVALGRGYVSAERNTDPEAPIGTIPVDSVHSPVKRVNYKVESARVGQATDFDKLVIEVWTNGTLSPREAVSKAARLLRDQLAIFDSEAADEKTAAGGSDRPQNELEALLDTNVEELELSVRSANCLKNAGIRTLRELVQRSEKEMLETKNFGRKSLNEIKEILREKGLAFGMKFEAPAGAGR